MKNDERVDILEKIKYKFDLRKRIQEKIFSNVNKKNKTEIVFTPVVTKGNETVEEIIRPAKRFCSTVKYASQTFLLPYKKLQDKYQHKNFILKKNKENRITPFISKNNLPIIKNDDEKRRSMFDIRMVRRSKDKTDIETIKRFNSLNLKEMLFK